ncbi:MAG: YbaN family protein [Acidobacteria bacterium]|nr:YbaN family protein [Acidobacteriota bacterium]
MKPAISTPETCPPDAQPMSWTRDLRRLTFAGVGVVSVGVGWIGVFVPGLPTTIFLIVASYCFTRSCPWLEQRLLRVPIFARYMKVLDEGRGMSTRAVVTALASMWSCVAVSLLVLSVAGRLRPWVAIAIVGAALVGTATILLYARKPAAGVTPTGTST